MNTIHFIVGNRGNIGKSFFSSLVCHFYSSNSRPFTLFDTDPDKQDVSSLYGGVTNVTFDACNEVMVNHSTDAIKVDRIYEEALKQDVIVNMPSNSHKADCLTQVPESIDIGWKERKGRAFMGS